MSKDDFVEWTPVLTPQEEVRVERYRRQLRPGAPSLRGLREGLGLTQEELAELLCVTQSNVSKLEARSEVPLSAMRKLVEAKGGRLKLVIEMNGQETEWPFAPAS